MHPYIERILARLGDRDPIVVLQETPDLLFAFFEHADERDLESSYAPGKWTGRQIIAHLADTEIGLGFRIRQALAEPFHRPQSFDQDAWAMRYARLDPALAVEAFRALRHWNLALFATFDLDDWLKPVDYPFEGIDSVDLMVRFMAGHDLNHRAQLERILRRA